MLHQRIRDLLTIRYTNLHTTYFTLLTLFDVHSMIDRGEIAHQEQCKKHQHEKLLQTNTKKAATELNSSMYTWQQQYTATINITVAGHMLPLESHRLGIH